MKKKNLDLNDPITSTSDIKIVDIVEAVAKHLGCPRGKAAIESAVREMMAQGGSGAIDGSTVTPAVSSVLVTREGSGLGVKIGVTGPGSGACDGAVLGSDPLDYIKDGANGCSPRYAMNSRWFQKVLQNGEVWTPYTNRRFLPAQYLHLMSWYEGNVSAAVARRYSMKEFFRLMDTEVEKLIWIAKHWKTAFAERSQFLTVDDCKEIFREYLTALQKNVNDRGLCTFSKKDGEYWRRIQGEGRTVLWTYYKHTAEGTNGAVTVTEYTEPTEWIIKVNAQIEISLKKLAKCDSYEKILSLLRNDMPHVSMGTFKDQHDNVRHWLPKRWKECFLKAGAYYTLKSLVVNKHVLFTTEEGDWRHKKLNRAKTAREGLNRLQALLKKDVPSFVVHAILKKSMEASGLDLAEFLNSIAKH